MIYIVYTLKSIFFNRSFSIIFSEFTGEFPGGFGADSRRRGGSLWLRGCGREAFGERRLGSDQTGVRSLIFWGWVDRCI